MTYQVGDELILQTPWGKAPARIVAIHAEDDIELEYDAVGGESAGSIGGYTPESLDAHASRKEA